MQARKSPAAESADWERALEGVDFPAAKIAIMREVHDHGGLDREVLTILEGLPKDEYDTREELAADARAVYEAEGYDTSKLPI
jgi:hypothetical protein